MRRARGAARAALAVAVLAAPAAARAEEAGRPWPTAIADNSFFIEEAYNQEKDVVQHISGLWRDPAGKWSYGFTQEWPVRGPRHQLSYTVGYAWADPSGLGDVLLNYRLQLGGERGLAVAPRLSLLLPRGARGGRGAAGMQLNLPASRRLSAAWVVHGNAGLTVRRRADTEDPGRDLRSASVGGSAIWLARPEVNLMLEALLTVSQEPTAHAPWRGELLVSPGLRRAFTVRGVQVVPGLAVPVRLAGHDRGPSVFAYLSLEHSFR